MLRVERAYGGVEHLRRLRLLRAEGGLERRAEPVQERHARRRLFVAHVRVRDLAEARDLAAGPATAAEVAALGQRHRRAALQEAVAVAVGERRAQRRAGCRPPVRALVVAAAREHERDEGDDGGAGTHHSSRSPATTGSRSTRRATSAIAPAASASRPASTIATWPGAGASGSDAKPAASRATSGPNTAHSSTMPATAAGSATAAAAPASTVATARASPPHARSSATAPRRSRAVIVSACTSA